MKFFLFLYLSFLGSASFADQINCHGNLSLKDGKNKIHDSSSGTRIPRDDSYTLSVVDNNRKILVVAYPWMSIQTKIILKSKEQKKQKLKVESDGMNWFSVSRIDSKGKKENIICTIEENEND